MLVVHRGTKPPPRDFHPRVDFNEEKSTIWDILDRPCHPFYHRNSTSFPLSLMNAPLRDGRGLLAIAVSLGRLESEGREIDGIDAASRI